MEGYVVPKCWLPFTGLHDIISQQTELFNGQPVSSGRPLVGLDDVSGLHSDTNKCYPARESTDNSVCVPYINQEVSLLFAQEPTTRFYPEAVEFGPHFVLL